MASVAFDQLVDHIENCLLHAGGKNIVISGQSARRGICFGRCPAFIVEELQIFRGIVGLDQHAFKRGERRVELQLRNHG